MMGYNIWGKEPKNISSKSSLANLKYKGILFVLFHDCKENDTYCFNECFNDGSFPKQKLETLNSKTEIQRTQLPSAKSRHPSVSLPKFVLLI